MFKRKYALALIIVLLAAIPFTMRLTKTSQNITQKASAPLITKIPWIAFNNGGSRSGINTSETALSAINVNGLTKIWQTALPYKTNGAPVTQPNVTTPSGVKDIVYFTTQKGNLVALDASTGVKIWEADPPGTFVASEGTSSTPAIDPSGLYVYSYGLDGNVHKYAAGTGIENTSGGFPVTATINPDVEKASSSLNIGNGYLYVTISGYDGNSGNYVGHIVAVNLATGTRTVRNALCSSVHQLLSENPADPNFCPQHGGGIWGRGGAVIDPVNNNVFVATGNGPYDANTGGVNYGDTIVELSPDLSTLIDTYTPSNFATLNTNSQDFASTAPVMLPTQAGSNTPNLALQGGEDNKLRLLNRADLSGQGGPNHVGGELQSFTTSCQIFSHALAWNDSNAATWIFVTDICGNLYGLSLSTTNGTTTLQQRYKIPGYGTTSPLMANNLLYIQGAGVVYAVDPATGNKLWDSTQPTARGTIGAQHWQSPLVADGMLITDDEDANVTAYAIAPPFTATPSPTLTPTITNTPTPTLPPTLTPTSTPAQKTSLTLTVFLHGRGKAGDNVKPGYTGNMNPLHPQPSVTLALYDASNTLIATPTGSITFDNVSGDYAGAVDIGSIPSGPYIVYVKTAGYLRRQLPGIISITAGQTNTSQTVYLVAGDATNDNQLDLSDYNVLISCFGSKQNQPSCVNKYAADFDDDGTVSPADYNLFLRELSVQAGN